MTVTRSRTSGPSDALFVRFSPCRKRPSRIDLLELDIDLRLADLWREAGEITEWNLEVVAAFMRAAYGKGYCDALTEDAGLALPRARLPRARAAGRRALALDRAIGTSWALTARRLTRVGADALPTWQASAGTGQRRRA